jgi:O-antigen/teichoic acid export membrane protein
VTPTYWVCNAIIVNQPGGYAELGVFNAASAWRSAILFLPAILGPLLLPFSSSLMSEGRADESMRLFRIGFALNTGIAAVLALLVIILADSIMSIYGPEFASANRLLVLLAILAVVMSATGSIWNTLMGWGCVWSPFVVSLVWSAAMIAGTWLLRDLGSEGLAWSSLAAHLLQLAGYLVCACLLVRRLAGAPMSKTRRSLERPALYSER